MTGPTRQQRRYRTNAPASSARKKNKRLLKTGTTGIRENNLGRALATQVIHLGARDGSGITECCGRHLRTELPKVDIATRTAELVTCKEAE